MLDKGKPYFSCNYCVVVAHSM